jgi:hypothetical protein
VHRAREPGGREHERERERAAEQRRGGIDVADVAQHARPELDATEGVGVGRERHFVLGAAVDVVEHTAWETPPSDTAEIGDVGGARESARDRVEFDRSEPHHRPHGGEDLFDAFHQVVDQCHALRASTTASSCVSTTPST